MVLAVSAALTLSTVSADDSDGKQAASAFYAGLRRSSYSWEKKKPELCRDNAWWAEKAKRFASAMSGDGKKFVPVVIEIVSIYLDDGHCEMEFAKPKGASKPKGVDWFNPKASIDHEKALEAYDKAGVKAIIQLEPGDADVVECLEIANAAFGKHPCVIGYGVDAEWYKTKGSPKNEGAPIPDADAKRWLEKVLSFNPNFTLFLKHWDTSHMPPTFRHPRLWFLSDSQDFKNIRGLLADFADWADAYKKETVGFQFGYKADAKWWKKKPFPASAIGRAILKEAPNTRFLFWVDFTAPQVKFDEKDAER